MAVLDKDIGLVTASITAQNTFSDGLYTEGAFNISIAGTFVATVTVQRSFDQGATWRDVDTFTAPMRRNTKTLKAVLTLLVVRISNARKGLT